MTEFLRLSGVYWGLTAMDLMGQLHRMDRQEVLEFIRGCHHLESGGFAPTLHHDPHLLYTLSAIQVQPPSLPSSPLVTLLCPPGTGAVR